MPLPLTRPLDWVAGQECDAADLQNIQSWARMKDAIVAYAVAGVHAYLPAFNSGGINCVPGSGLQVLLQTVGSAGSCRILLPHRSDDGTWTSVNASAEGLAQAAYYTPPGGGLPLTVPSPPAAAAPYRTDLIGVRFKATDVNGRDANVRSGSTVAPQTVYDIEDTIEFTYIKGTANAAFPAPTPATPASYSALYTVYVQHGDSSVGPEDITLVMPTYDALITAMGSLVLTTDTLVCPNVGDTFTVPTNGGPTVAGGYYFIVGPTSGHGLVAVLTGGSGTNSLTFQCLGVLFGTIGTNINKGALVTSIVQPRFCYQDGNLIVHTIVEESGVVNDSGAGGTYNVSLVQTFANKDNYRVSVSPFGSSFSPFAQAKTTSGFQIVIPNTGGPVAVEWQIRGKLNP